MTLVTSGLGLEHLGGSIQMELVEISYVLGSSLHWMLLLDDMLVLGVCSSDALVWTQQTCEQSTGPQQSFDVKQVQESQPGSLVLMLVSLHQVLRLLVLHCCLPTAGQQVGRCMVEEGGMKDRPCNSGMFGHSEVRVGDSPPLGAPVVPCFVRHIVLPG